LKLPPTKTLIWAAIPIVVIATAVWFWMLPVAEVVNVRRGTAVSAVYGTVRIESAFLVHVRAQNAGFIHLAEAFSAGRGAIGKSVGKGDLLATIADEGTARQLKQAQAELQSARERAALPLPSSELLKSAEDTLGRFEKLPPGNIPAADYQRAKSEAARLQSVVKTEQIERDRNLANLEDTAKKLESQMKNSEIRAPMDGLLTNILTIDGELVGESNELFTVSSRKNYVRGEVNEEDVGEVKIGMKANIQLYAYQTQQLTAEVSSIQPAADPETQRYTVVLQIEKPPENLMAGMTGEMNIITGTHHNVLMVPSRALLVDQALVINRGIVQKRTVKVGYHTLDVSEVVSGLSLGEHVVVADQDRLHPGRMVRSRMVRFPQAIKGP
jgi:RND family efflux transporter MFP subunit